MAEPSGVVLPEHEQPSGASPAPPRRGGIVRSPQDLLAGASLVALAFFALWASSGLSGGRLGSMGPGMLPRAVAVLVALVGTLVMGASLVMEGEALRGWSLRGPFFVTAGAIAFALTIRSVGLVVSGPLVTVVTAAASRETRVKEIVPFAILVTAFCVALFRYALHLPIPILVIPGVVVL